MVPALDLLRAAHPAATVVLVASDRARWFADRYPELVDELAVLLAWPDLVPGGAGSLRRGEAVVDAVRRSPPDLVLQLHGSGPESNELAARLGGRRLVVAARPDDPVPAGAERVPWRGDRPEPLLCLDVVAAATGRPVPAAPRLRFPVRPADRAEAARLRSAHPPLAGRFAVLHPGAALADRRWPPARFAAVAAELGRRGVAVAVTGTGAERPLAEAVAAAAAAAGAPAVPVAGTTSLGGLAALLGAAEVVVTNDTGPSHLAAAVGAPSVAVHLVTDPARWAPLDRTRHAAVDGRGGRDVTGEVTAAALAHLARRPVAGRA